MPPDAREHLLANLAYLRRAVDAPNDLNPGTADPEAAHAARFTRNGLAILGFVVLEDFVGQRGVELAGLLSNGPTHFDNMPSALRRAAMIATVKNLAWRIDHGSDDDSARDALIRQTGQELSTLTGSGFSVSPLALAWTGSNLGVGDIEAILGALHVEKPWESMTYLVMRLGFPGIRNARDAFLSLQGQRHRAAHQASTDIDLVALTAMPKTVLALAMAFDLLATNAASGLRTGDQGFIAGPGLRASTLAFRYLADRGKHYAELVGEAPTRAFARHQSLASGLVPALQRAKARGETLIVQDKNSSVVDWRFP